MRCECITYHVSWTLLHCHNLKATVVYLEKTGWTWCNKHIHKSMWSSKKNDSIKTSTSAIIKSWIFTFPNNTHSVPIFRKACTEPNPQFPTSECVCVWGGWGRGEGKGRSNISTMQLICLPNMKTNTLTHHLRAIEDMRWSLKLDHHNKLCSHPLP